MSTKSSSARAAPGRPGPRSRSPTRIELVRRFANDVRKEQDAFADLIARETGKPLWEARTEVEAVIAKVEISIRAYAERTGAAQARQRAAGHRRGAPQAARRAGGARPVQFPRAPAQRPHRPRADRRQRGGLQADRKDPGDRANSWSKLLPPRRDPRGAGPGADRRPGRGQGAGRASRHRRRAVHRSARRPASRSTASSPTSPGKIVALEMGGNNPIVVWDTPKMHDAATLIVQSAFTTAGQRCTAARRLIVKASLYDDDDRRGEAR